MRLVTNQTPVIQGPANGGGISFKAVIGRGRDGSNVIPTAEAVADVISPALFIPTTDAFPAYDPTGATATPAATFDAIFAAAPAGSKVVIRGDFQIVDSPGQLMHSIKVDLTEARFTKAADVVLFEWRPPAATILTVSSITTGVTITDESGSRTGTKITFAAPTGWARGQLFKLAADDVYAGVRPGVGDGKEPRVGEHCTVYSVTGNDVYVLGNLRETYATNIRAAAMSDISLEVEGGEFITSDAGIAAGWNSHTMRVKSLVRPKIIKPKGKQAGGQVFVIQDCVNANIINPQTDHALNDPTAGAFGYAVSDISSTGTLVQRPEIARARHGFTDAAPWVAANASDLSQYGRTRDAMVTLGYGYGTSNTTWDTHSWAVNTTYLDCTSVNSYAGIGLRGIGHRAERTKVFGSVSRAVWILEETTGGDSYGHIIRDTVVDSCGSILTVDINPVGGPNAGVLETRLSYLDGLEVRNTSGATIGNATLDVRRLRVVLPATLTNSSRVITQTNSIVTGEDWEFDYRCNTAGTSLAVTSLDATSELHLAGEMRLRNTSDVASRMSFVCANASASVCEVENLDADFLPTSVIQTPVAAASIMDYFGRSDGRSSDLIGLAESNLDGSSTTTLATLLARTRRPVVNIRAVPTTTRTLPAFPAGSRRGQVIYLTNATTNSSVIRVPSNSGTYKAVTLSGATTPILPGETMTMVWSGFEWREVHKTLSPYEWRPTDQGLMSWSVDPALISGSSTPGAGVLTMVKVPVRRGETISNLWLNVVTGGSGLTAGGCFAVAYDTAGNRLGTTADQSTAWQSTGTKQMAITPTTANDDYVYVAFWWTGTTGPAFARGANNGAINAGMSSAYRAAVANTGLTTTAPNPFGTQTANSVAYCAAVN